jgi:hypothetical protein
MGVTLARQNAPPGQPIDTTEYSVFYSWQTDSPKKCNREFIRMALDRAVAAVAKRPGIVEAPRVDSGMEGIAGTPEVASIMFEKIGRAAIFVGDITLVGNVPVSAGKKKIPNSNVTLEMGYAAGVLGWDRVICVINEHFGGRDELPFDVRNRRFPIKYRCAPDSTDLSQAAEALADNLRIALETVETCELRKVERALERLDLDCLQLIHDYGSGPSFKSDPSDSGLGRFPTEYRRAITRLLDLDLLRCRHSPGEDDNIHEWTYLGTKVTAKVLGRVQPRR